jgi:hypothetical protein
MAWVLLRGTRWALVAWLSTALLQNSPVCGAGTASACKFTWKQFKYCPALEESSLRTFFDPANDTQQLYASANIRIATDEPESFLDADQARFAQR